MEFGASSSAAPFIPRQQSAGHFARSTSCTSVGSKPTWTKAHLHRYAGEATRWQPRHRSLVITRGGKGSTRDLPRTAGMWLKGMWLKFKAMFFVFMLLLRLLRWWRRRKTTQRCGAAGAEPHHPEREGLALQKPKSSARCVGDDVQQKPADLEEKALRVIAAELSAFVYKDDQEFGQGKQGEIPVGDQKFLFSVRRVWPSEADRNGQSCLTGRTALVSVDFAGREVSFVVFRGTHEWKDWLKSLPPQPDLDAFNCGACGVHSAIYQHVRNIFPNRSDEDHGFAGALREACENGANRIVFTGHSLGGAFAESMLLRISNHPRFRFKEIDIFQTPVQCITFGSPAIFYQLLASSPEGPNEFPNKDVDRLFKRRSFRLVNGNDPVPRLPSQMVWGEFLPAEYRSMAKEEFKELSNYVHLSTSDASEFHRSKLSLEDHKMGRYLEKVREEYNNAVSSSLLFNLLKENVQLSEKCAGLPEKTVELCEKSADLSENNAELSEKNAELSEKIAKRCKKSNALSKDELVKRQENLIWRDSDERYVFQLLQIVIELKRQNRRRFTPNASKTELLARREASFIRLAAARFAELRTL